MGKSCRERGGGMIWCGRPATQIAVLTREMEQLQLAKEQKTNKLEEASNKVRGMA